MLPSVVGHELCEHGESAAAGARKTTAPVHRNGSSMENVRSTNFVEAARSVIRKDRVWNKQDAIVWQTLDFFSRQPDCQVGGCRINSDFKQN